MRVEKTPISTTCSPTKGECEWIVKVTNVGAAELKGKLVVNEVTFGNGLPMKQELQEMQLPAGIACNAASARSIRYLPEPGRDVGARPERLNPPEDESQRAQRRRAVR